MKNLLHKISDKSDAAESNLWYGIKEQIEQENLMRKAKKRKLNFSLTSAAAILAILLISTVALGVTQNEFARTARANYHVVTIDDIEAMSTEVNHSVTQDFLGDVDNFTLQVDWAYADSSQIVMAITLFDAEGNVLMGADYPEGTVELWQDYPLINGDQVLGDPETDLFGREELVNDLESTQQIIRYPILSEYLERQANLPETLQLEARFLIGTGANLHSVYPINFDVAFGMPQYEQHRDIIALDDRSQVGSELDVLFRDLVISESATSVEICFVNPDNESHETYNPSRIDLYVDGQLVDNAHRTEGFGRYIYVDNYLVYEHPYHMIGDSHGTYAYCKLAAWNIGFEELPDTVRVEIPSLLREIQLTETEATQQLIFDLIAESGHPIEAEYNENCDCMHFSWLDSSEHSHMEKLAMFEDIRADFAAVYPPELVSDEGWEHIFDITEIEIIEQVPSYYRVTAEDIAAMATPMDVWASYGDQRIHLDWAYADKAQVVIAYTIFDAEGNALLGSELDDGSIEIHHFAGDNMQYSATSQRIIISDPDASQQVAYFPIRDFTYDVIQSFDDAMILREPLQQRIRLQFRADDRISAYLAFDIPVLSTRFEQDNGLVDFWTIYGDEQETSEQFEVFINHLTISDSAVSVQVCINVPENVPEGLYLPSEVLLSVDGDIVEASHSLDPFSAEWETTSDAVLDRNGQYYYWHWLSCGQYIWQIGFDDLPETIVVTIPEILHSQAPDVFDSQAALDAYIDLYAAEGYQITRPTDGNLSLTEEHYPANWQSLDPVEKHLLEQAMLDAFFAQYPPNYYSVGTSYRFDVVESVNYQQITESDLEAWGTSLNLFRVEDEMSIQMYWAYADANQIVLSFDLYEADGVLVPIASDEAADTVMDVWMMYPVMVGSRVEYRRLYNLGEQAAWTEDDPDVPRIGQYYISPLYFPMRGAFLAQGIDIDDLDSLQIQVEFYANDRMQELPPTHVFDFAIPFSTARFEQHNDLIDLSAFPDIAMFDDPATEIEIMFNDLVISDSSTVLLVCARFPKAYRAADDVEFRLFADGELVETVARPDGSISPLGTGEELDNERLIVQQQTGYHDDQDACFHVMWHVVFETLPDSIRVEMFSENYVEGWDYNFVIAEN